MTREEAIDILHELWITKYGETPDYKVRQAIEMAIKALEQEPCIQEKQANADKIDVVYIDGFKAGYSQARFDLEQEPKTDVDKARTEIQNYANSFVLAGRNDLASAVSNCITIIDKYKGDKE